MTVTGGAAEYVAAPVANCVGSRERRARRRGADRAAVVRGARLRRAARRTLADHVPDLRRRDDGPDDAGAGQAGRRRRASAWSTSTRRAWRRRGSSAARPPWRRADELDRAARLGLVIDCTGVVAAIEDGLARVGKRRHVPAVRRGRRRRDGSVIEPYEIYNQEITHHRARWRCCTASTAPAELFADGRARPGRHRSPTGSRSTTTRRRSSSSAPGVGRKIQVTPTPLKASLRSHDGESPFSATPRIATRCHENGDSPMSRHSASMACWMRRTDTG